MPASCMLIRPLPNSGREPNGLGKLLMVKSQMKPASAVEDRKQRDENDDVAEQRAHCAAA